MGPLQHHSHNLLLGILQVGHEVGHGHYNHIVHAPVHPAGKLIPAILYETQRIYFDSSAPTTGYNSCYTLCCLLAPLTTNSVVRYIRFMVTSSKSETQKISE